MINPFPFFLVFGLTQGKYPFGHTFAEERPVWYSSSARKRFAFWEKETAPDCRIPSLARLPRHSNVFASLAGTSDVFLADARLGVGCVDPVEASGHRAYRSNIQYQILHSFSPFFCFFRSCAGLKPI